VASVRARGGLGGLAALYGVRPCDDSPFAAVPVDEATDLDDLPPGRVDNLAYEADPVAWGPIDCGGQPTARPQRFIDGTVFARTAATFVVDGALRPAVLAAVGAAAMELDAETIRRVPETLRFQTVLCLLGNGIPGDHLTDLEFGLDAVGIELLAPTDDQDLPAEFEVLRRRAWDLAKGRMEAVEREVLQLAPEVPTVVDGLLERRLVTRRSQRLPAYGVVKRHLRTLLPTMLSQQLFSLAPGQRSPAFLVETEKAVLVSWYLRLADPGLGTPTAGIVRVAATRAWLELGFPDPLARFAEVSAVSAWLCQLRCRDASYARSAVSLEPIVRLEDQLHAVLPPIAQQLARLHRAFAT
jgi:hypothetical protein